MSRQLGVLGIGLNVDLSNFETTMTQMRRQTRLVNSEMRANAESFGQVEKSAEGLEKNLKSLNDLYKIQERMVKDTKKSLDDATKSNKENSKAVEDATIKYNNAVRNLNKYTKQIQETEKHLKQMSSGFGELSNSVKIMESDMKVGESAMQGMTNSSEGLESKLEGLQGIYKAQDEILGHLVEEYKNLSHEFGETSDEATTAYVAMNDQVTVLNNLEHEIDGVTEELRVLDTGMEDLSKTLRIAESDFKVSESAMIGVGTTSDVLGDKLDNLNRVYKAQEDVVDALREEYEYLANEFGETSDEAVEAYEAMNDQVTVLNELEGEIGEVTSELDYLDSEMDNLTRTMRVLESDFKVTESAMDSSGKSAETLGNKLEELQRIYEVQEKIVDELRKEYERLADEFGETSDEALEAYEAMNDQVEVLNRLEGEIKDVNGELSDLENEMSGVGDETEDLSKDFDELGRSGDEAAGKLSRMADSLDKTANRIKKARDVVGGMARGMNTYVTAPAMALGGAVLKEGLDYKAFQQEAEMSISLFVGGPENAKEYMDDLMDFAKTTPFAFPDLVSASQKMLGYGMAAEDTLPVIEAIANSVAAMGGGTEEIAVLSDVFAKIESNGKITGEELNRFGDQGINALKILANQQGVSMEEMRKNISNSAVDSEMAINGLVDGIMNGTDGVEGETAKLGGSLDALEGTWSGSIDSMKGAWRRMTDEVVSDELFEDFIEAINRITDLIPSLIPVLTPLVEGLANGLLRILDVVEKLVYGFEKLPKGTQESIADFGLMVIAIGPVLGALTGFLSVLGFVVTGLAGLSRGIKWAADVFKKVNKPIKKVSDTFGKKLFKPIGKAIGRAGVFTLFRKALSFLGKRLVTLLGPIGLVVGVIWTLVDVFKLAYDNSETFRKAVDGLWDSIKEGIGWLGKLKDGVLGLFQDDGVLGYDKLSEIFKVDSGDVEKVLSPINKLFHKVMQGLGFDTTNLTEGITWDSEELVDKFKGGLQKFLDNPLEGLKYTPIALGVRLVADKGGNIGGLFEDVKKSIGGFWSGNDWDVDGGADLLRTVGLSDEQIESVSKAVDKVKGHFDGLKDSYNGLKETYDGVKETVGDFFGGIGSLLEGGDGREEGMSILESIGLNSEIVKTLDSLFGSIGDVYGELREKWDTFWEEEGPQIKEAIGNILNIGETIKKGFTGTYDWIVGRVDWVVTEVSGMYEKVTGKISEIYDGFTEDIKKAYGFFKDELDKIWTAVEPYVEGIKLGVSMAFDTVVEEAEKMWGKISPYLEPVKEGIVNSFGWVADQIGTAFGWIKDEVTGKFDEYVEDFRTAKDRLMPYVEDFKDGFVGAFEDVKDNMKEFFDERLGELKNIVPNTMEIVRNRIEETVEEIGVIFGGGMDVLMGIVNIFTGIFTLDFSKMWEGVQRIFRGALDIITGLIDLTFKGWEIATGWVKERVVGLFTLMWDNAVGIFERFRETTAKIYERIKNSIVGAIETARDNVVETLGGMKDRAKEIFDDIVTFAKELPGKIGDGIKSMAEKAVDGLKSMGNSMARQLGKVVNGIIRGINNVTEKLGVKVEIEEWEVPQFSKGTKKKGHAGGPMTVGDHGVGNSGLGRTRELVQFPNGETRLFNKETTINAPPGTEVLSNKLTERLLDPARYSRGTDGAGGIFDIGKDLIGNIISGAVDVWDAISSPKKLMENMVHKYIGGLSNLASFPKNFATGVFNQFKDGALGFLRKSKEEATPEVDMNKMMNGFRINYGYGNPPGYPFGTHYGIDTNHVYDPVKAPIGGTVLRNFYDPQGGNAIEVQSGKIYQWFMHMSRSLVKAGEKISAGQVVGISGNTGSKTTGPHLHYQLFRDLRNPNGSSFNPLGAISNGAFDFFTGGIINDEGMYRVGERGSEAIIPLNNSDDTAKLLAYVNSMIKNDGKRNRRPKSIPDVRGNGDDSKMDRFMEAMIGMVEDTKEALELQREENAILRQMLDKELVAELDGKRVSKGLKPHLDRQNELTNSKSRRFGRQ